MNEKSPEYKQKYNKTQFKINNYLTLRLERGASNIYVGGRLFNQCKYLLLNIPTSNVKKFKNIESIDEAIETLSRSMEGNGHSRIDMSAETEFWGHCSNLQAWVENNYDTRLLHRNLAFPLLKALADEGDPKARKVFKEEIAIRLVSGYPSVVEYLTQQGFLQYLGKNELTTICEDPEFLKGIIKNYKYFVETSQYFEVFYDRAPSLLPNLLLAVLSNIDAHKYAQRLIAKIRNSSARVRKQIMGLLIDKLEDGEFYTDISDIINIFGIDFLVKNIPDPQMNRLLEDPHSIFQGLLLRYDGKIIPIQNSEFLDLSGKKISDLTKIEGLANFREVTKIILDNNNITDITGLECLHNLQEISAKNNKIKGINGFEQFPHLFKLNLNSNQIKELKGLNNLKKLRTIDVSNNKILEIDCKELPRIETINLTGNLIRKIHNTKFSSKFILSCKINNRIAVNMEDKEIRITIDNNASILFRNHSIYIEKNGLLHQHTVLDKMYSGFTEFTPIFKETKAKKKTKISVSELYPLGIDTTNYELDGKFREMCSNLQIWVEKDYDLRLLRKDLVYPLIEQLGEIKDSMTKKLLADVKNFNPEESEQIQPVLPEQQFIIAGEPLPDHNASDQKSMNGTILKRKLFCATTNELLSILSLKDFHDVEIKLLDPVKKPIKEVSEKFIRIFLKGALIKIKEENPQLSLEYNFFKNSDIIETMKISNLNSIHHYDLITEKMRELLVAA